MDCSVRQVVFLPFTPLLTSPPHGVDTNADNIADMFTTTPVSNNYSAWQNVKTVTVSLLISGETVSQLDAKTYQYADMLRVHDLGN